MAKVTADQFRTNPDVLGALHRLMTAECRLDPSECRKRCEQAALEIWEAMR